METTRSVNETPAVPRLAGMTDNQEPQIQDAHIQAAQQQVLDEARKVNDQRLKAVEELATAVAFRVDLERQVHEAKKEEKRLMTAAEKQGWTRAQVNKFARAPKNTRRTQSPNNTETETASTETTTDPAADAATTGAASGTTGTPTDSH